MAFARRWLTGDERTVGLVLAVGLLTTAFFRLDKLRHDLGVAAPSQALALLAVAVAVAWWSMLPRGFVWLEPAVLTWEDFGAIDRVGMVSRRLLRGWVGRQLALAYLLALLTAIVAAPAEWVAVGAAVVVAAGLLALAALRHTPDYGTLRASPRQAGTDIAPRVAGSTEAARRESGTAETGLAGAGIVGGGPSVTGIPDGGPGKGEIGGAGRGVDGTVEVEIDEVGSPDAPPQVEIAQRQASVVEVAAVLLLAVGAVAFRPGPLAPAIVAGVLTIAAIPLLARSGPPRRPHIATTAHRTRLVDGWRDRILRTTGVHFLDVGLLLPAARPVDPRKPARIAWLGVRARARHLTTAGLLALTAVAAHLAFERLNDEILFALTSYLALVPLAGGLGDLWRSPGRRRWVGRSDTALRVEHFVVFTAVAGAWAATTLGLAMLAGHGWKATVLLTIPLTAACAVRTAARPLPSYDNLGQVDTPIGAMPLRLIFQTLRGPDIGVLALIFLPAVPALVRVAVVTLAVLVCVLR
ncbi:MAG: hypothetical protein ACRDSK_09365 [Actinophytocola sp.]|uniref:hypothetical protein n=1 Tax=Actinophytocola sp. TaxID=1872138 RepID=UPI003D6A0F85